MGPPKSRRLFGEREEQGSSLTQNGAPEKAKSFFGEEEEQGSRQKVSPHGGTDASGLCSDVVVTPTRIELVLPP